MIGWIILAIWAIGWLGFSVTISRVLVEDTPPLPDEGVSGRAVPILIGMVVAVAWPLVIPGGWVYRKVWGKGNGA